jgi:methylenetetrahydrofolate--tRNA-(uracil-5-)-methyltransferase
MTDPITVVGGGLAGAEAAWQIAQAGIQVNLYEMRPAQTTGAHVTGDLAELICSNSLGSSLRNRPSGLLKNELNRLGSLLMQCAEQALLPAGSAMAVDREIFAKSVTTALTSHPNIHLHRQEVTELPSGPVVVASGPLTSAALSQSLQQFAGSDSLYFYDAISPTVEAASINMEVAFRASRYRFEEGEVGDYINCPLDESQYQQFIQELLNAQTIPLREMETAIKEGVKTSFFEACLPIEVLAGRNPQSLAYGPMRPVGIHNPHKSEKPRAVVQLRQEDLDGEQFNLVGFQTNLTYAEQKRVFRMIPGLESAEFTRFGQMHRNTYLNSPLLLNATLQSKNRDSLFFAGQIVGVEGYVGNIASGLLAGLNAARFVKHLPLLTFPTETMIGALHKRITTADPKTFQPVKANFGLLPPLENVPRSKDERGFVYAKRALLRLSEFMEENELESN